MKKLLALCLVVLMLAGCNSAPAQVATKTGLGMVNGITSSKSVVDGEDGLENGLAQTDITTVALTVDESGKILSISVDALQPKINFDAEGQLVTENTKVFATKKELKDDYGMRRASGIGKEWFEQVAAFEAWATGKTVQEVISTPTEQRDANHTRVPTDPDLLAGCTIDIGAILDATEVAYNNAK